MVTEDLSGEMTLAIKKGVPGRASSVCEASKVGKSLECSGNSQSLWSGIILMLSILFPQPWVWRPSQLNFLISRTHFKEEREGMRLLFELLMNFLLSVLCVALTDAGTCSIFLDLSRLLGMERNTWNSQDVLQHRLHSQSLSGGGRSFLVCFVMLEPNRPYLLHLPDLWLQIRLQMLRRCLVNATPPTLTLATPKYCLSRSACLQRGTSNRHGRALCVINTVLDTGSPCASFHGLRSMA